MNNIPFENTLAYYKYDLPEELIAQKPLPRGTERLLVLHKSGGYEHRQFADLPSLLPKGALLVANNSKVMPVRVLGHRATGGQTECLLLDPVPLTEQSAKSTDNDRFQAETTVLLRPSKNMPVGACVHFPFDDAPERLTVDVLEKQEFGRHRVILSWDGGQKGLSRFLQKYGVMPLPPYIHRAADSDDADTYQTVYARADKAGSAAAPTAGLHFTQAMREELVKNGFGWAELTLHVGYGTFAPVRENDIRDHIMHKEYIECPIETVDAVNCAKSEHRPVIAVGTTACRTLEGIVKELGHLAPYCGWTDIFIKPPYQWQVVDGLITNFHLPESTLLMLICALAGHDAVMEAYAEAVRRRYRFFSYGDAMLIY